MTVFLWVLATALVLFFWLQTNTKERPKKALGYLCLISLVGLLLVKVIDFFHPLPFV